MEHLLYHIIQHIKEHLPQLSLIDEDYGQLENLARSDADMYPLTYPALLIEVSEVNWEYLQGRHQSGTARLRVRLIVDCYDDTHAGSTTEYAILERDDLRRTVDNLLQGFRPMDDGSLMRERSTFYTFAHGIKVYETHYTLRVDEEFGESRSMVARPKVSIQKEVAR